MENRLLRTTLVQLDRVPRFALLLINAGFAMFVLASAGISLLVQVFDPTPSIEPLMPTIVLMISLSVLVLLGSAAGLMKRGWREAVLRGQGVVLGVGAAALLIWGIKLVVLDIPRDPDVGFAWTPGLFTITVTYGMYLVRRTLLVPWKPDSAVTSQSVFWVGVLSVAVEIGVMIRFGSYMREMMAGFGGGP